MFLLAHRINKIMIFFDSHTHLTDEQYNNEQDKIVENAKNAGVEYMVDVGYNKETSSLAIKNANKDDNVYATVGLHPENINEVDGDVSFA